METLPASPLEGFFMPLKCHFSYFSYGNPPNPKVKSLKMGHFYTVSTQNKASDTLLR